MKKAQVSVSTWIGVAVILIISIFVISQFQSRPSMEVYDFTSLRQQKLRVSAYIEECIRTSTQEAVDRYGFEESYIKNYLDIRIQECLLQMPATGAQIQYDGNEMSTRLTISEQSLTVDLHFPLTFQQQDATTSLEDFSYQLNKVISKDIPTDEEGRVARDLIIVVGDGSAALTLFAGTYAKTSQGMLLSSLSIGLEEKRVEDRQVLGFLVYDAKPDYAVFSPFAILVIDYKDITLPPDMDEQDLAIAWLDPLTSEYRIVPSSIDTIRKKITAKITHFSTYAIIRKDQVHPAGVFEQIENIECTGPPAQEILLPADSSSPQKLSIKDKAYIIKVTGQVSYTKDGPNQDLYDLTHAAPCSSCDDYCSYCEKYGTAWLWPLIIQGGYVIPEKQEKDHAYYFSLQGDDTKFEAGLSDSLFTDNQGSLTFDFFKPSSCKQIRANQDDCSDTDVNEEYPNGINFGEKGYLTTDSESFNDTCMQYAPPALGQKEYLGNAENNIVLGSDTYFQYYNPTLLVGIDDYKMWYLKNADEIMYTESEDGIRFSKPQNVLFYNGLAFVPDHPYHNIVCPRVIYERDENIYKLWYYAEKNLDPGESQIDLLYAESGDGINFVPAVEPSIEHIRKGTWAAIDTSCFSVTRTGQEYTLWYTADNGNIYQKNSFDGIAWNSESTLVIEHAQVNHVFWNSWKNQFEIWLDREGAIYQAVSQDKETWSEPKLMILPSLKKKRQKYHPVVFNAFVNPFRDGYEAWYVELPNQGSAWNGMKILYTNSFAQTGQRSDYLKEYYCSQGKARETLKECQDGCYRGRCIKKMHKKALLLIHNPIITSSGKTLIEHAGYNDPLTLAHAYTKKIDELSGGMVEYGLVAVEEDNRFPLFADGSSWEGDEERYFACTNEKPECQRKLNYTWLLEEYALCDKINSGMIDEVFYMGGPWFGAYESRMGGPNAFYVNSPPFTAPECERSIMIMGFNYERGLGEMLHDFGHRTEDLVRIGVGYDLWDRFDGQRERYDHKESEGCGDQSPVATSGAHCGNVHFPPNAQCHYEADSLRRVESDCDDWYNYPYLSGQQEWLDCNTWQCDADTYLSWWFTHLPAAGGKSGSSLNNWWRYTVDYENLPNCGNGKVEDGEVCDYGKQGTCDGCLRSCIDNRLAICNTKCQGYVQQYMCDPACSSDELCYAKLVGDSCALHKVCNEQCSCIDQENFHFPYRGKICISNIGNFASAYLLYVDTNGDGFAELKDRLGVLDIEEDCFSNWAALHILDLSPRYIMLKEDCTPDDILKEMIPDYADWDAINTFYDAPVCESSEEIVDCNSVLADWRIDNVQAELAFGELTLHVYGYFPSFSQCARQFDPFAVLKSLDRIQIISFFSGTDVDYESEYELQLHTLYLSPPSSFNLSIYACKGRQIKGVCDDEDEYRKIDYPELITLG